jgi:DNA transformation protein and related proteins
MATDPGTVDYILEQVSRAGGGSALKMFGEYALYRDGKVVALICDDQLFVKPTEEGRAPIGMVTEGAAYPGAKPSFLIAGDLWDDADWLSGLIRTTADALPMPKPKKPKAMIPK